MKPPGTGHLCFDEAPLWMKGASRRFQRRVPKRALEMNEKVPESSKNKASKSDKKPEEEPETQEEGPETQPEACF